MGDLLNTLHCIVAGTMGTNLLPTKEEGEIPDAHAIKETPNDNDEFVGIIDVDLEVLSTLQQPGERAIVEYDSKAFSSMPLT